MMRAGLFVLLVVPAFADVQADLPIVLDYYPVHPGAVWTYRSSAGAEAQAKVLPNRNLGGRDYAVLQLPLYYDKIPRTEHLIFERGQILIGAIGGTGDGLLVPPIPLLRSPLRVGATWSAASKWKYAEGGGEYDLNVEGKVVASETLTVPAGRFRCLKVQIVHTFRSGGGVFPYARTLWLTPRVGIVRMEIQAPVAASFELKEYRPARR